MGVGKRKPKIVGEMVYPLRWPGGQPRRLLARRQAATFQVSLAIAVEDLLTDLKLLGARYVAISTDIPLNRMDSKRIGLLRWKQQPIDTGVAIYFDYDGEQRVFACDKWRKVEHNVRAVGLTINSIRSIARWGSTDMMNRTLHAFKALPPDGGDWRAALGFSTVGRLPELAAVKARYRKLAADAHPDRGGNQHEMVRLNKAWEAAQKELV